RIFGLTLIIISERVSAYGAVYSQRGDFEEDLRLSIVGTSNGHIYSMELGEKENEKCVYADLQSLISAPQRKEFVLREDLSAPFIKSGNERIVSIASSKELFVLGQKGTLLRCKVEDGSTVSVLSSSSAPS
ncbi:hypothetical protein PFISCL1PPCAC_20785, partial [Pristionchus fissidentatus]